MLRVWCRRFTNMSDKTSLWSYITLHLHNWQRGLKGRDVGWFHLLLKPSCACPHVKLYRPLKEVVLTVSIWGQEGLGVKHFLLTWKHTGHTLLWDSVVAAADHLYLHNLGFIEPKQKPCVNYLWRCNDFRATADLHLVSKVKLENRLRFRHVTVVLSHW